MASYNFACYLSSWAPNHHLNKRLFIANTSDVSWYNKNQILNISNRQIIWKWYLKYHNTLSPNLQRSGEWGGVEYIETSDDSINVTKYVN